MMNIYLSIYLSIHPSIHPSIYLSIYLSISIYIYICMYTHTPLVSRSLLFKFLSIPNMAEYLLDMPSLVGCSYLLVLDMGLSEYRVPPPSHFWAYCTLFRFYYPQIGYGYPKINISMDWSILDIPKQTSPKYHFFHALIMCILFLFVPTFLLVKSSTLGMPKPYVPWPKVGLPRSGLSLPSIHSGFIFQLPW